MMNRIKFSAMQVMKMALTADLLFMTMVSQSQNNGAAALSATATTIRGYATSAQTIILSLGLLIGLIGGVRVYSKMHNGDPDTQKAIVGWFGAALFLVAVGAILTSFFG